MSSYKDMYYYKGDIYIRNSSSIDRLVEQGALLQFNADENKFLWVERGMSYVTLLFETCTYNVEDKIKEYEKEVDKYTLGTDIPLRDGVFYIKADTLVEDKPATRYVNFPLLEEFDKHHGDGVKPRRKK